MVKRKINVLLPEVVRSASGGHKVVYEYCNYLVGQGYEIHLYYMLGNALIKYHIPEKIRFRITKYYGEKYGPSKWFSLNSNINKHVISDMSEIQTGDIVIATGVETAEPVSRLDAKCGKKFYFIQGFENWFHSDEYVFSTYKLGMTNIVVSKWLKKIVDDVTGKDNILISNGIDTSIFYDRKVTRKKHSIVYQYRSGEYKGGKYGLEVINKLSTMYEDLSVHIISPEKANFDIPNCCTYHYNVSANEVAEINNKCQIFMCTTVNEGFGLPGLEAMACGCAVASTSYEGVLEYAIDRQNAMLSPIRDVEGMIENIVKMFEDDRIRMTITDNGKRTGAEKTLEKSAAKFESTLLEITAK